MSFLDNLENNLKALENIEERGADQSQRREAERNRALAIAPWADRLKEAPFTRAIMQSTTVAGRDRRMKVNLIWIGTAFRMEARGHRLELRPTPKGIIAVFLHDNQEVGSEPVDLAGDPVDLTSRWMKILDEQKRVDDATTLAHAIADADEPAEG